VSADTELQYRRVAKMLDLSWEELCELAGDTEEKREIVWPAFKQRMTRWQSGLTAPKPKKKVTDRRRLVIHSRRMNRSKKQKRKRNRK
jgi:hypothetical protein